MSGSGSPSDLAHGQRPQLCEETITRIISNAEIEVIMKIVKSLEDSGLLIKGVTQTIENEKKEQRVDFLLCQ